MEIIGEIDYDKYYDEAKRRVDRFSYDGFFHYLLSRHDDIRLLFCQWMIPYQRLVETTLINGEYYPHYKDGKKMVLDITAKDENGNLYNIEMQCYTIEKDDAIRFQLYAYRVLGDEAKRGKSYNDVKPMRQMIINNASPLEGFDNYIHHFVMKDVYSGKSFPYSLYEIYLVQLHYLDMENIDIQEFDEFMYLFKNDSAYDKMNVSKNVQEAIVMHDEYIESKERIAAIEREREEMILRSRELSIKEGEAKNKADEAKNKADEAKNKADEAKNKADEAKNKADEAKNKADEAKIKESHDKIIKIIISYLKIKLGNVSPSIQNEILNSSLEQLEKISLNLADIENEQQLLSLLR